MHARTAMTIMFPHNASALTLAFSQQDTSVNTWKNKVTCGTYLKK